MQHIREDIFGATAATLVALPSAIAFGLIATSPLGVGYAAAGVLAGILGVIAFGLVAPLAGGTPRLISSPCAPAAAMMAAFGADILHSGKLAGPGVVFATLILAGGLAGAIQILFGVLKGGRFIKFIPYPVVAGYMSGVGLIIFTSQLSKLFGIAGQTSNAAVFYARNWSLPALLIGGVSIVLMVWAPRFIRSVPAPIVALFGGMFTYLLLAGKRHELAAITGNPLVVGMIPGFGEGRDAGALLAAVLEHWRSTVSLRLTDLEVIFVPALMMATLLSIDTLKTCVVLGDLTRSRHNSNRELIGQGGANLFSAFLGGMSGSGGMGPTLVNLNSGGKTCWSGELVGVFTLAVALLLGRYLAWISLPALAGILIVIGLRLVDWNSICLLQHPSTRFDFAVIAAVTGTALAFDLITAAGAGITLAIILFVRDQIRGSVIRRLVRGNRLFSNRRRIPPEQEILEREGDKTLVAELHGSLFFGTTDQLMVQLEPALPSCRFLILDMQRIHSVDFTVEHMLEQLADRLHDQGALLILSGLHARFHGTQNLTDYFARLGLLKDPKRARAFPELDEALEWTENELLKQANVAGIGEEKSLGLAEVHLLGGLSADTIAELGQIVKTRYVASGETIFAAGDPGDELFLIRRGSVRILLSLGEGASHHLATFGRGDFFGDMSFLDRQSRSADAVAEVATDLYVLSAADFDRAVGNHPRLEGLVYVRLAHALALRLRRTDTELRGLEEA